MDFINNLSMIKRNWRPSSAWEFELKENEYKDSYLYKKYPPTESQKRFAKQYGRTVVNVVDKLDQASINKSADAMIAMETITSLPTLAAPFLGGMSGYLLSKNNKIMKDKPKLASFNAALVAIGIVSICNSFISSQLEKITTRIARFQARKKELNNISEFVVKTNNIVGEEASNIASLDKNSWLNPIKMYKDAFKTLREMQKDYKEYRAWKAEFNKKESAKEKYLSTIELNAEERKCAQIDRNNIISLIKNLELASNEEEINFKYAANVLNFLTKISAAALVTLVLLITPKADVKTYTGDAKKIKFPLQALVPVIAPVLSLVFTSYFLKLQKDSAKLGRFEKKRDLLENESNFLRFDDKSREEVKEVKLEKNNKGLLKRVFEDLKSIKTMPQRLQEMYRYQRKNSKTFNTEKIGKEFTEEELQKAKLLQHQLFYSFEKIDEKSEGFVDDVDAVIHAATASISTILNIGYNLYSLNLLSKKLKNINNNKAPGFFDSLRLMKFLKTKDFMVIFVIPYVLKSLIGITMRTVAAQISKKANRIGIYTAIQDLKDERLFSSKYNAKL